MTQEFKSIEEIKEEVAKEFFDPCRTWKENSMFSNDDNINILEDSGAINEVAKRYAQQFKDEAETYQKGFIALQEDVLKSAERNKELVEMLEDIRNRMEVGVSSYEQVELALTELITKQKQNERVLGANQQLTRLTEMSGDHFDQIFIKGFAPSKIKSDVAKLNSLFGFHDMIAKYGHFESYPTAAKLNYDVEFKLDRVQALDTTHDKGKEGTIK